MENDPSNHISTVAENDARRLKDYEENIKYLLDSYPKSIRIYRVDGSENLMQSLHETFGAMRKAL